MSDADITAGRGSSLGGASEDGGDVELVNV